MSKSGKIFMNLVMLSIFAVMVGVATQYPPQARFMPFVVGIPGLVLCLIQLAIEIRGGRGATRDESDGRSEMQKAAEEVARITGRKMDFSEAEGPAAVVVEEAPANQGHREVVMWSYVLGLIGGVLLFGFWISIPFFLLTFYRFFAQTSWRKAIVTAVLGTAGFYLAFVVALGAILHEGFVVEMIKERFGLY